MEIQQQQPQQLFQDNHFQVLGGWSSFQQLFIAKIFQKGLVMQNYIHLEKRLTQALKLQKVYKEKHCDNNQN
ncbi:unnamed protein product [Paramecium octaurelia]|uniref:Uncharacterized protein n=1 Tax=Paramecium octaurelia TaxID=43137 RepID=A0A8S1UIF0_PAROT|nr:unnamed protein product [Paramecium octaurelia]